MSCWQIGETTYRAGCINVCRKSAVATAHGIVCITVSRGAAWQLRHHDTNEVREVVSNAVHFCGGKIVEPARSLARRLARELAGDCQWAAGCLPKPGGRKVMRQLIGNQVAGEKGRWCYPRFYDERRLGSQEARS